MTAAVAARGESEEAERGNGQTTSLRAPTPLKTNIVIRQSDDDDEEDDDDGGRLQSRRRRFVAPDDEREASSSSSSTATEPPKESARIAPPATVARLQTSPRGVALSPRGIVPSYRFGA